MTMTTEHTTPMGSLVLHEDNLTLNDGNVLRPGDEFLLPGLGEDGAKGYFTFKSARLHECGSETVECFGGDRNPKGRRSFRSFDADHVRNAAVKL